MQSTKTTRSRAGPEILHQVWAPPTPIRTREVDSATGLVYDEVQVRALKPHTTWMLDPRTPSIARRFPRKGTSKGSRSMLDICLTKICFEARDLSKETLAYVPWELASRIWSLLIERHQESLHLWRTFATAYPKQFSAREYRYLVDMRAPSLSLDEYYKAITSLTNEWMTCLRVGPKQTSARDMVAIHKITNLIALDLSDGQLYMDQSVSTFDAHLMRTWVDLAKSGRGFQNLEVLMLGWQDFVGFWLFDSVQCFPRLKLLVLTDCHQIHHKNHKDWQDDAFRNGWDFMPSKRGVKHLRPYLNEANYQSCGIASLVWETEEGEGDELPLEGSKPLLEFWLNSPKPWLHIIEDFPGTKTVVLHKKSNFGLAVSVTNLIEPESEKRIPSSPKAGDRNRKWSQNGERRRKSSKMDAASLLADFS